MSRNLSTATARANNGTTARRWVPVTPPTAPRPVPTTPTGTGAAARRATACYAPCVSERPGMVHVHLTAV